MSDSNTNTPRQNKKPRKRTPQWIRRPGRFLSQGRWVAPVVATIAIWFLKLVYSTNKIVTEPEGILDDIKPLQPIITAVWHGQHILIPAIPIGINASVMISKNIDGEITARVAEHFGNQTIRASGGRDQKQTLKKGGMTGFLEMLKALKEGRNVVQTADVPKGTPRRAGEGIIALAQKSGRPIVPLAIASSRRHVFSKAWDRAALSLPFGTTGICVGELIYVPAQASAHELEACRMKLEAVLNDTTKRAYALTGVPE
ncbi:MAG: lysophospholipid acyltransferase family protein [Rhizobiaceae bacterium]|nr:lysophospholipid acyltransferase family protein [Rhizobiaceae bacterium]MBL4696495.1 lysophospholipid acyltransferase family protein [Rhizobiaceae bacterium]